MKKLKYSFILISVLILFIMVSCTPAPKESGEPLNRERERVLKADDFTATAPESTHETPVVKATTEEIILNPPHGEPGHSCDIPVGAPLNSPAASPPVREVRTTSFAPTVENAARLGTAPRRQSTSTTTAPSTARLNPPHGQPGHRCEIPVGSPLY
jgi:hypothetical protein